MYSETTHSGVASCSHEIRPQRYCCWWFIGSTHTIFSVVSRAQKQIFAISLCMCVLGVCLCVYELPLNFRVSPQESVFYSKKMFDRLKSVRLHVAANNVELSGIFYAVRALTTQFGVRDFRGVRARASRSTSSSQSSSPSSPSRCGKRKNNIAPRLYTRQMWRRRQRRQQAADRDRERASTCVNLYTNVYTTRAHDATTQHEHHAVAVLQWYMFVGFVYERKMGGARTTFYIVYMKYTYYTYSRTNCPVRLPTIQTHLSELEEMRDTTAKLKHRASAY